MDSPILISPFAEVKRCNPCVAKHIFLLKRIKETLNVIGGRTPSQPTRSHSWKGKSATSRDLVTVHPDALSIRSMSLLPLCDGFQIAGEFLFGWSILLSMGDTCDTLTSWGNNSLIGRVHSRNSSLSLWIFGVLSLFSESPPPTLFGPFFSNEENSFILYINAQFQICGHPCCIRIFPISFT